MKRLFALVLRQVDDAIAGVHIHRCRRAERRQIQLLKGWWAL